MEEKKDKNSINDDLINNKANNKNDYKTFNILKDISPLLLILLFKVFISLL